MSDEIEAIRERHQEAEHDNNSDWATDHGAQAHFDRETLLRLLDAAEAALEEERAKVSSERGSLLFWVYAALEKDARGLTP